MGAEPTQPGWLVEHSGHAFAFILYLLSTLTFALTAIIVGGVLPALPCLGIAAAVAAAIVAAIWPAQRRHYAELRSRAARS